MIYLEVLATPLVFLNSAEAATDLLQKRGNIYSDRPHLTMAGELYVVSAMNAVMHVSHGFSLQGARWETSRH
jgi:hypothetical protein